MCSQFNTFKIISTELQVTGATTVCSVDEILLIYLHLILCFYIKN